MQIIKDSLKTMALSAIVLSLVGIALAWTEPSSNPPAGNASAPLTVSSFTDPKDQIKYGGLGIDALDVVGGATIGGNVGINTLDTGTYKLNVGGDVRTLSGGDLRLGTTVSGTDAIIYSDNGEISFNTNSATRMLLGADGNLGISGSVKIGNQSATCSSTNAGSLRYNSNNIELCNGAKWKTVTLAPDAPTVTLTVAANPIATGQSTTLTWSVDDVISSCTASASPADTNWSGVKSAAGGSITISPTSSITYTLSCVNAGGTGTSSVAVDVKQWTSTTGKGNFNESCDEWLARTGQSGVNNSKPRAATGECIYGINESNWETWVKLICPSNHKSSTRYPTSDTIDNDNYGNFNAVVGYSSDCNPSGEYNDNVYIKTETRR